MLRPKRVRFIFLPNRPVIFQQSVPVLLQQPVVLRRVLQPPLHVLHRASRRFRVVARRRAIRLVLLRRAAATFWRRQKVEMNHSLSLADTGSGKFQKSTTLNSFLFSKNWIFHETGKFLPKKLKFWKKLNSNFKNLILKKKQSYTFSRTQERRIETTPTNFVR